jgi:uncharacterized protein DUF1963
LNRLISVIGTFFVVLVAVMFAIGVSAGDTLKGPDAFVRRWSLISLAVTFSAFVAWIQWKLLLRGKVSSRFNVRMSDAPRGRDLRSARGTSAAIAAASKQAIVFRQHFPPKHQASMLSFFGGAPIAPSGFRWPRPAGSGAASRPFSFLMQIDCAAVPVSAGLGVLPDRGVLYFFLDLTWGQADAFRVLYEEDGHKNWVPVQPPDDLGPAFGDQATYVWKWTQSIEDCPKLLPKWTFDPVAIEVPSEAYDPSAREDDDAPLLWPGEKSMGEALRAAQGDDVLSSPFAVDGFIDATGAMRRPFTNYPHDWRAIQICSGLLLEKTREPGRLPSTWALRELSEFERNALVTRINDEARNWFNRASPHAPFAPLPQTESDQFWSWLADKAWLVRFVIGDALTMSVEASLGDSPEAAARIPAEIARRVHSRHALAVRSANGLFVTTPDRMLAPPVDVQGHQLERARTHLLLLELSSNDGLGHHFGEGVYQFWITPADLKARRFDKVELSTDAY